jgi:heme/copper-type cytochrome/quinol oxidase subunit 2
LMYIYISSSLSFSFSERLVHSIKASFSFAWTHAFVVVIIIIIIVVVFVRWYEKKAIYKPKQTNDNIENSRWFLHGYLLSFFLILAAALLHFQCMLWEKLSRQKKHKTNQINIPFAFLFSIICTIQTD